MSNFSCKINNYMYCSRRLGKGICCVCDGINEVRETLGCKHKECIVLKSCKPCCCNNKRPPRFK